MRKIVLWPLIILLSPSAAVFAANNQKTISISLYTQANLKSKVIDTINVGQTSMR